MIALARPLAAAIDGALEATIVASFTTIGVRVRSRIHDWPDTLARLDGQTAIVTGGTSGIGKATAIGLLELGADVHLTSRSAARALETARELNEACRPLDACGTATGHALDTGDTDSILSFVAQSRRLNLDIDLLINNAGALSATYRTDERGRELTLSTHLIGPYLLTRELRPALAKGALVLFMSSGGMYTQGLDVDAIEVAEDGYKGAVAYAKAKRGQVELVAHLGPRWAPDTIVQAVHPGWVATPGVDAGLPGFGSLMGPLLRTAEEGADTMLWLAASGGQPDQPGRFWLDRRPRRTSYLPGTSTTDDERELLLDWLETESDDATTR